MDEPRKDIQFANDLLPIAEEFYNPDLLSGLRTEGLTISPAVKALTADGRVRKHPSSTVSYAFVAERFVEKLKMVVEPGQDGEVVGAVAHMIVTNNDFLAAWTDPDRRSLLDTALHAEIQKGQDELARLRRFEKYYGFQNSAYDQKLNRISANSMRYQGAQARLWEPVSVSPPEQRR